MQTDGDSHAEPPAMGSGSGNSGGDEPQPSTSGTGFTLTSKEVKTVKRFLRMSHDIQNIMRKVLGEQQVQRPIPGQVAPFEIPKIQKDDNFCHICKKHFRVERNLRQHTRLHAGGARYKCSNCSKMFASSLGRNKHQDQCGVEKMFACTVPGCRKWFATRRLLTIHLKSGH